MNTDLYKRASSPLFRPAAWLVLLFTGLLLLAGSGKLLYALDGVAVGGGVLWTGNSRTDIGAPGPVQPALFLGFPFHFGESRFSLDPFLALHRSWYLYHEESSQAVPAELEHRDVTFLNLRISGAFRFDLFSRETWSSGPSLSLNLHLPIPVMVWRENDNLGALVGDLYGDLKFLLPGAGWFGSILLHGKHRLHLAADVLFPIHRFWDGTGLPFWDGMGIILKTSYLF